MRWVGYVALWETGEVRTWFWLGDLKEGDHLEYLDVDNIEMDPQEEE
jgi:hypothetical protein